MDTVMSVPGTPDPIAAVTSLLLSLGIGKAEEVLPLAAALSAMAADGSVDGSRRQAVLRIGAWFSRHLGQANLEAEQAFLIGRAAFVALGAAERWPGVLLAEAPPAEFIEALAAQAPRPCPALPPLPMVMQAIETPSLLAPVAALIRGASTNGARTA